MNANSNYPDHETRMINMLNVSFKWYSRVFCENQIEQFIY